MRQRHITGISNHTSHGVATQAPPVRPPPGRVRGILAVISACFLLAACGRQGGGDDPSAESGDEFEGSQPGIAAPGNAALAQIVEPWTGDLDGMVERRIIRVLTAHSPVLYFVDRGRQRGMVYELVRRFEKHLNAELARRHIRVHLIILPVARDELIPRLVGGQGDLAIAQLTITPERQAEVDFSIPVQTDVAEILVTGPAGPGIRNLEDLAGREVYVRASSSYAEHLAELNDEFTRRGLAPVRIDPAGELLEAGDILEMVHAGLVPATVVDTALAELYAQVFDDLKLHPDIQLNSGGRIAWAFRKNSPGLASVVNDFIRTSRRGTMLGNVLAERYAEDTRWVENARDEAGQERFRSLIGLFRKYGEKYGLDPLLLVAQGYQESELDHSRKSSAGAVGIMQMLPSTARDKNVGIADITGLENNIEAAAKYLSWIMDRYFNDPDMPRLQRELFALAAYNAGPARVARLRREAEQQGLDPDEWFNNVEIIAARRIGRETVQYVANIYKYYLAYEVLARQVREQNRARERALGG
ncbi:MAG: transporter substrate-binding domain-containing protein [Gammaproteobacteria bacterium]